MKNIFNQIPMYAHLNKHIDNYFDDVKYKKNIPILEKEEIAKNFPTNYMTNRLKSAISDGGIEYASTSGTTSEKLMLIRPINWWQDEFQRGYNYSSMMNGFSMYEQKKVCLSTAVCSANTCFMDNPNYEERIIGNTLYLNAHPDPYLWTKDDIIKIEREINEYSAELLEVDPVYLAIFLKKRTEYEIKEILFQPKYITCSYEFLTNEHKKYIQSFFSCPVLNLYGSTELGVIFIQGEEQKFHRCPEKTIVELIPVKNKKGIYELVITSWKNEFMPLLRYRTGDVIELSELEDENHNRNHKFKFMENEPLEILKIHGRLKDAFYLDNGELVTVADLDEKIQECDVIPWQYQIEINTDRVIFRFVSTHKLSPTFDPKINFYFLNKLFPKVSRIDYFEVDYLRNEASGKYRLTTGNNLRSGG